ncbi:MAG TPA: diguanylate cyclase [bacterium]|nr:diguanylate cyclase [bacterium]
MNKRELVPAALRGFLGLVVMYLVYLGLIGEPGLRLEIAMAVMISLLVAVFLSLLIPERWEPGSTLLFLMDISALSVIVFYFGGAGSPFLYVMPVLVVDAVYRFKLVVSGSVSFLITSGIVVISIFSGTVSPYKVGMIAAVMAAAWSVSALVSRTSNESKYKLLFLEQEHRNEELEERIDDLEKKLQGMTIVDPDTGLKNFRYFRSRIDEEIKRAERGKYPFSIVIIQLNDLDEFRDIYDYKETKRALHRIGIKLKEVFRTTDLIGRLQENQFLIMLPEAEGRKALIPVMRLRKGLESMNFGTDNRFNFNFSIGVSTYPEDTSEMGGLLNLAVNAVGRSKEKGSGMVTLASSLQRKGNPGS